MNIGYFYAFLTAILWSFAGISTRFVSVGTFIYSGIVSLVAFVCLQLKTREKLHLTKFTVMVGIFQFLMIITFVLANRLTTVGNAIILQYSSLIFVLIFDCIDHKRKPKPYQIVVIGFAVLGMILFFFDSFDFSSLLGNMVAVLSGFFFGLEFYLNTKEQAHPRTSLKLQYLFCVFSMFVSLLFVHEPVSIHDVLVLCATGFCITFFAGLSFSKCITLIPAFSANVICMSEIFLAPLWAFIFLQEKCSGMSFMGAIFMVSGLLFNVYKEIRLEKKM